MDDQRGQALVEYVGLMVVAGLLVAAIGASGIPGRLAGSAVAAIVSRPAAVGDLPSVRLARAARVRGALEALDSTAEPAPERELLDRYIAADLDEFLAYRDSPRRDARLEWSTDLCSAPLVGSVGAAFDFTGPCIRHDFGYRNSKRLDVFAERKAQMDLRFLQDMKDHCATRIVALQRRCYRWAYTFYYAVREFGRERLAARRGITPGRRVEESRGLVAEDRGNRRYALHRGDGSLAAEAAARPLLELPSPPVGPRG